MSLRPAWLSKSEGNLDYKVKPYPKTINIKKKLVEFLSDFHKINGKSKS